MSMRTKHALAFHGGPAICGVGQGAKLFQLPTGTPVDDLPTLDIEAHVNCKRCLARVRKRFPLWFDIDLGLIRR